MDERIRLGVDVGGTFTDLVALEERSGLLHTLKTPSTLWPLDGVVNAVRELSGSHGVDVSAVGYFSHGSTIAVNTLLERSGARVGLITTQGFRDILELRRLRLPKANDFFVERPRSLVPRHHVREVEERMLADGGVLWPVNREEVETQARYLVEQGVQALAISFLHAYRNARHEVLAKGWIEELFPDLYVCTSSEVWPQQREYERTLVTVINAYVGGRMQEYFSGLDQAMAELGMSCRVFSTKSNGGVMTARSAAGRPVETLLSGPASGVIGAAYIGRLLQEDRLVTFDMGGTSVDISIIKGDVPYSTDSTVGDFPVIMPTIDVISIGAGGGSIAWLDREGVLKVGPRSAGAVPGPACYGQGGIRPTITDAYVLAGIIEPRGFLGGQMTVYPELAHDAIRSIAEPLGMDVLEAADAILQVATSKIYAELVPQMARRGADLSNFSILAYGGAGPTHIFRLARELPVRRVIIPQIPGALAALGCLVADFRADFLQTLWRDCDTISDEDLAEIYRDLEGEARRWLMRQDVGLEQITCLRSADMCYVGQSFELNVRFPLQSEFVVSVSRVVGWFYDHYERVYGYVDREAPVRLLDARLQIVGVTPKPPHALRIGATACSDRAISSREVYDQGKLVSTSVYQRSHLEPGDAFPGPALVEEYDSTIYIPSGFRATVDSLGNIHGEVDH